MQARLINKTPMEWLKGAERHAQQVLGRGMPPRGQVLGGFLTDPPPCVMRFEKHTFVRAVGSGSKYKHATDQWGPGWWANSLELARIWDHLGQFEGFLSDQEIARLVRPRYRELMAIAFKWTLDESEVPSDLVHFFELNLDGNGPIEGIVGRVAPQRPFPDYAGPALKGGAEQALLYVPMGYRITELRI